MHSNVEAIQVQRTYYDEQGEHVVHPTAIRKKIPFRKKVRERNRTKNRVKSSSSKQKSSSSKRNTPGSNNHQPSSIWRRQKRSASKNNGVEEVGGFGAPTGSSHKTENKSSRSKQSNTDSSASASSREEETINLVQLQTPPVTSNIIDIVGPGPLTSGGAQSQIMNCELQLSSTSDNNRAANVPDIVAGSRNSPGVVATTSLVNHHEPKTVILPSASSVTANKGRKKRFDF